VRRHVIPGARPRKIDFAQSEYEPGRRSGQAGILKGAVAANRPSWQAVHRTSRRDRGLSPRASPNGLPLTGGNRAR
jgi:hypothetical protein